MARKHGFFRPHVLGLTAISSTTLKEGVGVFEPGRNLFQPGDILLDYDPADLTTMFKDVNGTLPVTADGDSIALHLDKGQWGGKTLAQLVTSQPERLGTGAAALLGTATAATYNTSTGAGTVTRVDGSNQSYISIAVTAGNTYRVDLTAGPETAMLVRDGGPGGAGLLTVSSGQRSVAYIRPGGAIIAIASPSAVTGSFTIHSVKEIPGYHRTQATGTSQRKYKTDGTLHWSLYDGSDDGDVTPTINWGTDEFASCSGLYKANDTVGVVFEFSATQVSNAGAFYVVAGNNGGNGWSTSARGSAPSLAALTATQLTDAPDTAVITALGDIAGDLSRIWRNRVLGTDGTLDKGTGNFGSYALYFGRRGGASLPFNGREYRTVIRNRLWSDTERAQLETFIAEKSGVTL